MFCALQKILQIFTVFFTQRKIIPPKYAQNFPNIFAMPKIPQIFAQIFAEKYALQKRGEGDKGDEGEGDKGDEGKEGDDGDEGDKADEGDRGDKWDE